jgi:TatD DNase family protein
MIDSHCHLTDGAFENDVDSVVSRALEAGVRRLVTVGVNVVDSVDALALARRYDRVYATVGVHPHDAESWSETTREQLRELASEDKVVAVGEVGLDYYRNYSPRDAQVRAFREQIRLAKDVGLPLVFHVRSAYGEAFRIVEEENASDVGGVFHFFSGTRDDAQRALDMGFHVSVGGPVTFSNADNLREVVRSIPTTSVLAETDAPYAAPVPFRGKRCEPAHVSHVVARLAELYGVSALEAARDTSAATCGLFSLPRDPDIAYARGGSAYLNVTNECTNRCTFCVRNFKDGVYGYNLKLERDPTADEIVNALGNPSDYNEVVFCGFGEPTTRLPTVIEVAGRIRPKAKRLRLNTNGHGNLIAGRDIVPDISGLFDAISVSIGAHDAGGYVRVCRPKFGEKAFESVLDFVRSCRDSGIDVEASVVAVPEVDVEECRCITAKLGVPLRVREHK